MYNSTHYMKAI